VGALQPEGSSRRGRATVGDRQSWGRNFVHRRRRDFGPSRTQADSFAQTVEESRFTVIVPPPSAATQLEEMRAPALGKSAPLLRDLIECMGRRRYRHGEALGGRSSRPDGRVVRWHAEATTGADNGLCQDGTPESRENDNSFQAAARGKAARDPLRHAESLAGGARGVAQKLTRPDGEIRAGRVDRRRGSGGRERRSGL
jgi:hypothetical protein